MLHGLDAYRALDDLGDLFDHVLELAPALGDECRVCCHPVYDAYAVVLLDHGDVGGVDEELHSGPRFGSVLRPFCLTLSARGGVDYLNRSTDSIIDCHD